MSGTLHEYLSVFHTFGSDNCSAATEISLLCFLCNASNVSEIPGRDTILQQ